MAKQKRFSQDTQDMVDEIKKPDTEYIILTERHGAVRSMMLAKPKNAMKMYMALEQSIKEDMHLSDEQFGVLKALLDAEIGEKSGGVQMEISPDDLDNN